MAAHDKYGGVIDVKERRVEDSNEEDSDRRFVVLFGNSVFHNGGQVEDDGLHDKDVYVDLRANLLEDIEIKLTEFVTEGHQKILSNKKVKRLEDII